MNEKIKGIIAILVAIMYFGFILFFFTYNIFNAELNYDILTKFLSATSMPVGAVLGYYFTDLYYNKK